MTETTIEKYAQLTVFPEVAGEHVQRKEVHMAVKELSDEDWERGPSVELANGIHLATVSENTPPELFEAAHLLNAVSWDEVSSHANGFVPTFGYDSAIAVVDGRVVGGVLAKTASLALWRVTLKADSGASEHDGTGISPRGVGVVWNFWVHPAHRRKGLGRQLLEAIATHLDCTVGRMGFWLPISKAAVGVLLSMGIKEVAGCY